MYARIIQTKFKNNVVEVLVFVKDEDENDKVIVEVRAMYAEYFLIEEISFESRDCAYDFIENYPVKMAKSFVDRQVWNIVPQDEM